MDEYFVEEKSGYDKLLDFLVFIAVFTVTIFLILDILAQSGSTDLDSKRISDIYKYINIVVFGIFFADLFRLWKKSSGFKDFISKNSLDILATIPFGFLAGILSTPPLSGSSPTLEVFKWFRVAKLSGAAKATRLARISKISKQFKAASHLKKEGEEYKKKHRL